MNRSFIMLLALVLFLGAGFGGSFVGGVIYGQNQAESSGSELSPRLGAGGQFTGGGQGAGGGQRGQGRQGQDGAAATGRQPNDLAVAGGQESGPELAPRPLSAGQGQGEPEDQPRATPGRDNQVDARDAAQTSGDGNGANPTPAAVATGTGRTGEGTAQGGANRGGATGTVRGLDGDVLTVASPRGELSVMLSEGTRVFRLSETDRQSLAAESRVRVVGPRNPEGGIAAHSVVIVPEGVDNLFGGGGPGGRSRGQAP